MGGGNAQKSAIARAKNAKNAPSGGNSTLKTKDKDMTYQCKVCKQTFMCTAAIELLIQHIDNKHKGKPYEDCFEYTYVAAPNTATVYQGPHRAHIAFGTESKKGFPKDQDIEEFDTKEEAYEYIKEKVEYINDDESITYVDTD
eukprot:CAMPEP_0179416106 /NCGR_PEP_ID=MMETSP0799-20121207/6609_1 /TAXON_ID=46947 /ORGANISM="Geminigera cryophila, Strain CCMP2564" /LENGTH=142 /DNA_ID=CAMNT_0021188931 /DNA_START=277 /DNA_END=705 /DNA_ORIENTATION=-